LVVHNIGSGTKEEDVLLRFKLIIGHYRLPAEPNKLLHATALRNAAREQ
jgi:hypothetical protein